MTPKPDTFDDDLKGYPGKPKGFVDAENKVGTTPSHPACGSLEGVTKDYYSGLVAVDENIGRILSYLEKKNILDDTAIVHTSDHGYLLGEWRMFDKRLMHEPSIRVPLMVRYPKAHSRGNGAQRNGSGYRPGSDISRSCWRADSRAHAGEEPAASCESVRSVLPRRSGITNTTSGRILKKFPPAAEFAPSVTS